MTKTRVQQKIYELFDLDERKVSPKGWLMSPNACPFCGKANEHFGIKFTKRTAKYSNEVSFRCLKCDAAGGDFLIFQALDMLTFYRQGVYIKKYKELEKRIDTKSYRKKEELDISVPKRIPPLGFRRVMDDEYLRGRGFQDWQFETYHIGRTKLFSRLKEYVIIRVMWQGWLGAVRSIMMKKKGQGERFLDIEMRVGLILQDSYSG